MPNTALDNPGARGLPLATIAGTEIRVDWSLWFVFALVAIDLGAGLFPQWHPEWGPALSWAVALSAATLFFGSVLAHELAHALVGRLNGISVPRITLFMFGGMAHMEGEPSSPRAELAMAAVGPAVSLVIGIAATAIALLLEPGNVNAALTANGGVLVPVSRLGVAGTILLWLGPINVLLAIFNLLPGFPLDGGRVLRAVLWSAFGDRRKATRWAAVGGEGVSWLLIGSGIAMAFGFDLPFLGSGLLSGLWLILIGWFLSHAARSEAHQQAVRDALAGLRVGNLMRTSVASVPPGMRVADLVQKYFLGSDQEVFPVVQSGTLVGVVGMANLRGLPDVADVEVGNIMTPATRVMTMAPEELVTEALALMNREHVNQVPVVVDGHVRGLVRQRDVWKWLALQRPQAA